MAVTHGHGNPHWTRDETILALDLYFDCDGKIPSSTDDRVQALSELLRSFPHHSMSARKPSFRNADGVAFKLQNLNQVATGKGLGNTSKMDHQVWEEFGHDPVRTKQVANLIRSGIEVVEGIKEDSGEYEVFPEGKVVTETHLRRERSPKLRARLIEQRKKSNALACEICGSKPPATSEAIEDAMFEAHHMIPLAASQERQTKLKDMALLCANCHRMLHRAISVEKRWLSIAEARSLLFGGNNA
ncbi:HNH endonuclease [Halothiobacillus diazotrophicus]|uniref:HNH endonuclease n=1 Tax=Halothiobacillus diazotrophicus TaxID=1860122 RepID=A0A191ZED6_9GAMM|nr:HNH endonuclease [Halothiobacillus diazotrophicus]ANJ66225.1 HNH endonuclease [Halothiobacillus diazotrophicus]